MFGIYQRLGVPVWSSDRDVVRAAYLKINPDRRRSLQHRDLRKEFYRRMLDYHRRERELVEAFRL